MAVEFHFVCTRRYIICIMPRSCRSMHQDDMVNINIKMELYSRYLISTGNTRVTRVLSTPFRTCSQHANYLYLVGR
jgi:hypothetical protein